MSGYLSVVVYLGFIIAFAVVSLGAASVLRPHRPFASKLNTYECGAEPIGGAWVQSGWKKTHPTFDDYVVARIPSKSGDPESYFYRSPGGISWAVSSTTKHPQEAWEWFKWLHSREAAARWVKDGNGLRVSPDVNKQEYAPTAQFAQFLHELEHGVTLLCIASPDAVSRIRCGSLTVASRLAPWHEIPLPPPRVK